MTMFNGISGKTSIMRVLVSVTVTSTLAVWIAANVCCWLHGCDYINIGIQEVSLILGALAAKTAQRVAESKQLNGNGNHAPTTNEIPVDKTQ